MVHHSRASAGSSRTDDEEDEEQQEDDGTNDGSSEQVTARLKTYIKPRIPSTQEVLDRRARKNAQSRARAAKLRQRIAEIDLKPEDDRTEEEMHLWSQYEQRRQRKNDRSRERALEKKEEIDRILAKPDKKRSKIERQFLETALSAKKRKNEGDRLRRQRLKELGLSTKGSGMKPGISARGPLPPHYQHLSAAQLQQHGYGYGPPPMGQQHHPMGDIPMSPLPTMPHHHHHHHHPMQSPGFGSPGMMNFPSPGPMRGGPHGGGGTPGRHPHNSNMPYMPPPQAYDPISPVDRSGNSNNNRVEQRRNPDGSVSIQIGGPPPLQHHHQQEQQQMHRGGGEALPPPGGGDSMGMLENDNGFDDEGEPQDEEKDSVI